MFRDLSLCVCTAGIGLLGLATAASAIPVAWRGRWLALGGILGLAQVACFLPSDRAVASAILTGPGPAVFAVAVAGLVGSVALCGVGAILVAGGQPGECGLGGKGVGRQAIVGALLGGGIALVVSAAFGRLTMPGPVAQWWGLWLWVCWSTVGPAWQEEVVFRAVGLPALTRVLRSPELGNLVQACLFGALHLLPLTAYGFYPPLPGWWAKRAAGAFCLGWVFGYLRQRLDGIWAPYAAHATYNMVCYALRFGALMARNPGATLGSHLHYDSAEVPRDLQRWCRLG